MSTFIPPNISKVSSFSELEKYEKSLNPLFINDRFRIDFIDVFMLHKAIVLAEPGLGKTRLLQEIVLQAKAHNRKAIFISLKKSGKNILECIEENVQKYENNDQIKKDIFTSEAFQIENSANITVCLDALDEVPISNVFTIVEGIREFNKKYPDVSMIVSCRRNYYNQYASILKDQSFAFIMLGLFSKEQVEQFLKNKGVGQQKINELRTKLKFENRDLILQVPRYLCMLPEIITKLSHTNIIKKNDLFREFTYFKINTENEKKDRELSQKIALIMRVLEKIALIMEIHQSNILNKEDLITLFDDVKSNLCVSFLNQVDISILYERSLLRDNFDGTVQFENTEIQEYLAAAEISRLGHLHQVVFDFTVEPELLEVYPSWYSTLSFLVEIDPTLIIQLYQLTRSRQNKLQDENLHKLITSVPSLIPLEHVSEVFERIFGYYQRNNVSISFEVANNLANFPIHYSQIIIKENLDRINIINITRFIGYRGKAHTDELPYWKEILLKFKESVADSPIEEIIFAFGLMNDMESISLLAKPILYKKSKRTIQNIVAACISANPNHPFSIEVFVEGTKQDDIMARYGFYDITDVMILKNVFDYLIQDKNFRIKFIEAESIFQDKDKHFFNKIEECWDNEFEGKLIEIIIEIIKNDEPWYLNKSKLVGNLIIIAKKKDSKFVFKLIDDLTSQDVAATTVKNWYYLSRVIGQSLIQGQFGDVFAKLSVVEKGRDILFHALQYVKSLQTIEAEAIYKESSPYFQTEYEELESKPKVPIREKSKVAKTLSEFIFKLQPEPGKYIDDVFSCFWHNREALVPLLSQENFNRLKELIIGVVLDIFDLETTTLSIDHKEGNSRTYTTSIAANLFSDCLKIIVEYNHRLNINLQDYHNQFVGYIPFAYRDDLDIIFKLLPDLTTNDMANLLKVYMGKRKDDLGYFVPENLAIVCKQYEIPAVNGLRKIIEDDQVPIYARQESLKTLIELLPNRQLLVDLFLKFSANTKTPTFSLAEIANEGMIKKYEDSKAIEWRVMKLVERKFRFTRREGAHAVGPQEQELYHKDFARPVLELRDPRYQNLMINLVDSALEIYEEDIEYKEYGLYLWQIVCDYYTNLRETKSYKYLLNLIKHIEENYSQHNAYMSLSYNLNALKLKYLQYLGRSSDFATCIKRYNEAKEKQYLDISSPQDLVELISSVLDEDVKNWIEAEGAYSFIQDHKGKQEDLIQKTLKTQIENGLLRRGLRRSEVRREEQLLDDKRPDMLISYGFVGPILLELKRSDNKEACNAKEREAYKPKLDQYMRATGAHFGFFLIFRIKQDSNLEEIYTETATTYHECANIIVKKYDCIKSLPVSPKKTRKKQSQLKNKS